MQNESYFISSVKKRKNRQIEEFPESFSISERKFKTCKFSNESSLQLRILFFSPDFYHLLLDTESKRLLDDVNMCEVEKFILNPQGN